MWNPLSADLSLTMVITKAHLPLSVFDSGVYLVSKTILVPAGAQIVGNMHSSILGSGAAFQAQTNPTGGQCRRLWDRRDQRLGHFKYERLARRRRDRMECERSETR